MRAAAALAAIGVAASLAAATSLVRFPAAAARSALRRSAALVNCWSADRRASASDRRTGAWIARICLTATNRPMPIRIAISTIAPPPTMPSRWGSNVAHCPVAAWAAAAAATPTTIVIRMARAGTVRFASGSRFSFVVVCSASARWAA